MQGSEDIGDLQMKHCYTHSLCSFVLDPASFFPVQLMIAHFELNDDLNFISAIGILYSSY